jgi:hypothetical protein
LVVAVVQERTVAIQHLLVLDYLSQPRLVAVLVVGQLKAVVLVVLVVVALVIALEELLVELELLAKDLLVVVLVVGVMIQVLVVVVALVALAHLQVDKIIMELRA